MLESNYHSIIAKFIATLKIPIINEKNYADEKIG